jgi:hypothetical protein
MKKIVLAIVLVVLVCLAVLLWSFHRTRRIQNVFERADEDATEVSLHSQLGLPWRRGQCGQVLGGSVAPNCSTEIIYASPFAPLLPDYWAFRFDKDGKFIDKYEYVSP